MSSPISSTVDVGGDEKLKISHFYLMLQEISVLLYKLEALT